MSKSSLPADHEVRVLVTIKNGKITERIVHSDEIVGTVDDFVKTFRRMAKGLLGEKGQ